MLDGSGLYTAEEVKRLEQLYARFHDGSTYPLMERAGAAVYSEIRDRWPDRRHLLVLCGKGNNGGDGFVVARLAAQAGLSVSVLVMPGADSSQGDAERALMRLKSIGVEQLPWHIETFQSHHDKDNSVIVDALLGTGVSGDIRAPFDEAIAQVNRCSSPVVAVDLPSGLIADTGSIAGAAIRATITVTFIALKRGLLTGIAAEFCGELVLNDLKCGQGVFSLVNPNVHRFNYLQGKQWLKPRLRHSHKGHFGHCLVLGGTLGFPGAARLCSEAAARTGAGLVSLLTHPEHVHSIVSQRPEIMAHGLSETATKDSFRRLLEAATVIAVGPGMGQLKWGKNALALLDDYLAAGKAKAPPTVWDADALNLLAQRPHVIENRVITPHPGEAARLLNTSVAKIEADRFSAVAELAKRYGGVAILKGYGTLVADAEQIYVINVGNPGMATGGMGDTLTGIIAGLIAQGLSLLDAARLGVAIHGEAAELAVNIDGTRQERGLLASDLFPYIRRLVNPMGE
ncbi:NAD(P)H-hydrate dehydratase [Pleionea litopenaei]|uniref:Bifunctional NAD(P)H-hydrate repair enzyme n=1 Tax=Pleionea litopenaei TaxID=3070815 RepID=A0AA51RX05_9GAMM|nr:NAD(P)H-hydrate dehydratase [Pleionea sp. HL-JVS1]WMS88993.1 NAD(P)H-hydrate dehydratase [Pleionea sp. HL-JVS1]